MKTRGTRLVMCILGLAMSLWSLSARAFTSCPRSLQLLLYPNPFFYLPQQCVTGQYQITMVGAGGLGFSPQALTRLAHANTKVDGNEVSYVLSVLNEEVLYPDSASYDATHHFDHYPGLPHPPGISEDQQAFLNARNYVLSQRSIVIAALTSGDDCKVGDALDALGRALHAVQDLYSHSNYVDSEYKSGSGLDSDDKNALDAALLDTSKMPPAALKLTLYGFATNPINGFAGDSEDPTSNCKEDDPSVYCHRFWAKDFPGKNPISGSIHQDYSVFDKAVQAAKDATGKFIVTVIGAVGLAQWNNTVGNYGIHNSSCQPPCSQMYSACYPNLLNGSVITSGDPNDKAGSQGLGSAGYISGASPLRYAISFGNEPTASAKAQKVKIADQLNIEEEDMSTFSLGPISFGSTLIVPPTVLGDFSTTVDLRPSNNLLVAVNTHLDKTTGSFTWNLESLDPTTNLPPVDPTSGFLPPGGEGNVFFTIMPKQSLATDAKIQNQATVIFDANAPIPTPTWSNAIDNTPPVSRVLGLPTNQANLTFTVAWSGTDVGAGIQSYTIYVSDNGGDFAVWLANTTETSAPYTGQPGHKYSFYSVARDLVGNPEPSKTVAEASTQGPLIGTTTTITSSALNSNPNSAVMFTATVVAASGSPTGTITFFDGTTTLGTGTLSTAGPTTSTAAFSTSALAAGIHSITATYAGATAYAGSTSAAITQTVTAPALLAALLPTSIIIFRGSTGASALTLTPIGGYSGTVTLACGILPPHISCTFAPNSLSFAGANIVQTSSVTIGTTATTALLIPFKSGFSSPRIFSAVMLIPCIGLAGLATFRRRWLRHPIISLLVLLATLAASAALGLAGCGGGNKAAAGNYTIPVNVKSEGGTTTVNLTVVVE
jgi:Bacterial Ig-like domain (group 3)